MKTLKSILYAFIAVFVLAGCDDDADHLAGAPENPDCYHVYFPEQTYSGDQELDPAAETKLTFTARRLKSDDAIVVPVSVKSNVENIFTVSEIAFAEGQEQTTFEVSFPGTETGKKYTCDISIDDTKYASVYGEKSAGLSFSVTRVKWNKLTSGDETKGRWRDDVISTLFNVTNAYAEVQVEIYERADRKGYYRMAPYTPELIFALFGGNVGTCLSPNIIIDATDPEKVWIPYQTTGVTLGGDGEIEIASKVTANIPSVSESASAFGTLKDGVITFPVGSIMVNFTVSGGWYGANAAGMQRIVLPGAKVYDYSLALSKSEPEGGVVKLGFRLGADVAKVQYAFFSGAMNETVAEAKSKTMADGEVPVEELTETGTVNAVMTETGIYTVVANIYNEANELQGFSSLTFGYVKDGEERPVILTVKTGLTWQFMGDGHTPENSILGSLFGEDIETAYAGVFKTSDLAGKTAAELIETVKSGKPVSAENLEKLNDKGYSVLFTGLNGGTDYTLLVWAFNGYYGELFAAEQATEGKADPLQILYKFKDITPFGDKSELFKTWDLWGISNDETGNTNRKKIGQVVISENENDAVDQDLINVSGLSLGANNEDTVVWEYYKGILYVLKGQPMGTVSYQGSTLYLKYYILDKALGMGSNAMDYMMVGGVTVDGHIALVCSPNYSEDYNFDTFLIQAFTDPEYKNSLGNWESYTAPLLVEAAANQTAAPRRSVSEKIIALSQQIDLVPENFVELRGRERIHALIDEMMERPAMRAVKTLDAAAAVDPDRADARVTFSRGIAPSTSDAMRMIGKKVVTK